MKLTARDLKEHGIADEPIVPRVVLLDEDNRVVRDMTPFSVLG